MADDTTNGERKVLTFEQHKWLTHKVTREELDKDLTELSLGILAQYNQLAENTSKVLRLQAQAIGSLEARTFRGRIRRVRAWWALKREAVRQLRDRILWSAGNGGDT